MIPVEEQAEAPARTPEVERLLLALDLVESGIELTWWRLRREHPEATDAEIDARLAAWLRAPRHHGGRAVSPDRFPPGP